MPVYSYKAKTKEGRVKQGTVIAASKKEAGANLRSEGFSPLFVKKTTVSKKGFLFNGGQRLPLIEKANLCRYLGTMVKSGLPLTEAIEVLRAEAVHPQLKLILDETRGRLQKGQLLSNAFALFPETFDEVFLTLLKAGEESGTLDKTFAYLGSQLYADYQLRQKIKSTLAYPIVISLATLGLGIAMLVFVVPKISPVLLRLSATFELPTHTVLILKIGVFLSDNLLFFLAALAGLAVLLVSFLIRPSGRKLLNRFLTYLPLIKDFYEHLALARFSRTLSTLLKSGVPITNSLEVACGTLNLPKYEKLKGFFAQEISKGRSLAETLKKSELFPPIMTSLVATGEKTAALDKLLLDLALFYEEKVSNSLKTMTDIIEPVLMLAIGLAVGAAVISLIAPIYSFVGSLSQSIGGG